MVCVLSVHESHHDDVSVDRFCTVLGLGTIFLLLLFGFFTFSLLASVGSPFLLSALLVFLFLCNGWFPFSWRFVFLRLSVDICPHGRSSSSEANRLSSAGSLAISASIEGLVVRSPSSFTSVLSAMMISRVNSQARLEFRSFQWTSSVATMIGYVTFKSILLQCKGLKNQWFVHFFFQKRKA